MRFQLVGRKNSVILSWSKEPFGHSGRETERSVDQLRMTAFFQQAPGP
jgi:hypothetical protein